jgi:diaminohydroxyphosphoribosylaminopyrimidine deaminase/5-amino-6-(5-phosphoribosylamino)uracil reductase
MAEPRIVIPVVAGSSPVGHPPSYPMAADEKFMREAIRLAEKGSGKTRPNPAVGCVIAKSGRIIGRGWHRGAGKPHAELEALRSLKNPADARGATVYVTLEPCCTHGKTPPCTDALISAGVSRVVAGAIDPNPQHRGRGLALLRRRKIKTEAGLLVRECEAINPDFNHVMHTGRPWVVAKCGMSLDGRLTRPPGEGPWITSPAARRDAMKLRAEVDAVMVGAGTVRADDPALTLRGVKGRQPWRIIWAPRRLPPKGARLMQAGQAGGVLVLRQKSLRAALRELAKLGIHRVLLEGGGYALGQAFDQRLVQEVVFYVAPLLSGGRVPAVGASGAGDTAHAWKLVGCHCRKIGACLRLHGQLQY